MRSQVMRVLHLPVNVASQVSVTVRALQDIGVDARGIVRNNAIIQDPDGIEAFRYTSPRSHPARGLVDVTIATAKVVRAIHWADVVHWHCCWALPAALDVRYASMLGKPGIVEFWGSDIRVPEIAGATNIYRRKQYSDHPELTAGAEDRSRKRQQVFAQYGFACMIPGPDLGAHVVRSAFPSFYETRQRIRLTDYPPAYPDPGTKRPLVVHMPSNKANKGTDAVLRAFEMLKRSRNFDFELVHGVKREDALKSVKACDVFLDQFVSGSHGLASLEAMAFGKPTVCFIEPSLIPMYPPELPIINANEESLPEALARLLDDARLRYETGRRSRDYVERYHDSHRLASELVDVYQRLLMNRGSVPTP